MVDEETGRAGELVGLFRHDPHREFLAARCDALSDDTVVYPGHGRDTNLGIERPNVPEWRKRGW